MKSALTSAEVRKQLQIFFYKNNNLKTNVLWKIERSFLRSTEWMTLK